MTSFQKAMAKILNLVVIHKSILETHPQALAFLMREYDEIHYGSRFHEDEEQHDWDNPKYAVIDLEEKVGETYANLVYDAWASQIPEDDEGELHPLESKANKTLEEWVQMYLDPSYRYNSIFPSRQQALSHLMCCIGTGVKWNKQGCLAEIGPSGEDLIIYGSPKRADVPSIIAQEMDWEQDQEIVRCRQKRTDKIQEEKREKKKLWDSIKEMSKTLGLNTKREEPPFTYYPISNYSAITQIPDNAPEDYKLGAKEICDHILASEHESKENKSQAKKILKKISSKAGKNG